MLSNANRDQNKLNDLQLLVNELYSIVAGLVTRNKELQARVESLEVRLVRQEGRLG